MATFSGLTLDKAGTGTTLRATGTGLSRRDDRCHHRDRRDGDPARGDDAAPASVTAGSGFGLVVTAEDAFGNVDPSFAASVTLALANNPNGATLGGTLTVNASTGVATFAGLTLDKAGTGTTLRRPAPA